MNNSELVALRGRIRQLQRELDEIVNWAESLTLTEVETSVSRFPSSFEDRANSTTITSTKQSVFELDLNASPGRNAWSPGVHIGGVVEDEELED